MYQSRSVGVLVWGRRPAAPVPGRPEAKEASADGSCGRWPLLQPSRFPFLCTSIRNRELRPVNTVPRLSVGLPVYNGEKYLTESIESLLGQSYKDFELIISDNASTDSTADICRRYANQDSRIRYIRQPRNIGLAPNHNFVVDQSHGEFFKWAASDDLYGRELLQSCIDALDQHPDVVLAHSWTAAIDSAGKVIQAYRYPLVTDRSEER